MDHTVIAVDTAKKVFQLHWVEHDFSRRDGVFHIFILCATKAQPFQ